MNLVLIRAAVVLAGAAAATLVPAPVLAISPDTLPVALVRSGSSVWLADTSGDVVHEVAVDPASAIGHPAPGLVVFVGDDRIDQLDVDSGEVTAVPFDSPGPLQPLTDGQRLGVVSAHDELGPGGLRAAAPPPSVDRLIGLVDVITGETIDIAGVVDNPIVVEQSGTVLLVGDASNTATDPPSVDALYVVALDRPFIGLVDIPVTDRDEIAIGPASEGWVAWRADGGLFVSEGGQQARPLAEGGHRLIGALPGGVLAEFDAGVTFVGLDGTSQVVSELPGLPERGGVEIESDSGLLVLAGEDPSTWYRIDRAGNVAELTRVAGMQLIAAGPGGWWFSSGDRPAPFDGSPVVAVDPVDGSVHDVTGDLQMLASLAYSANESPDSRYVVAPFQELEGFQGLAVADARTGVVVNLDYLDPPLTFSPDGRYILSATVTGPTITTLDDGGGTTLINPIFDIEGADDAEFQNRWISR